MTKYDCLLAIDPDCEKNGIAYLDLNTKRIQISCLSFPETIELIQQANSIAIKNNRTFCVYVEAGWLNKSNFHLGSFDSRFKSAKIGNDVGRNHETGRKIIEMCKHHHINTEEIKPLRKIWSGPGGKITHGEIKQFIPDFPKSSNQEIRDAALLCWYISGNPIKINTIINNHIKRN
jgi:hypothetical protein